MGAERNAEYCRRTVGIFILTLFCVSRLADSRSIPQREFDSGLSLPTRSLSMLVQPPQTVLTYHNGPLLTESISVYVIWYGSFTDSGKQIIRDFFASFASPPVPNFPTVVSWWHMTGGYVDLEGAGVSPTVTLAGELDDAAASLGTSLTEVQVQGLVLGSLTAPSSFPADPNAVYFVLTSENVSVDSFCPVCGSHATVASGGNQLPYSWVGNSATQCPGQCAWPFAKAAYGPPLQLTAPNGDVGVDGMVINIAALLAGAATDPLETGYYQGDPSTPLEAASACPGIYGAGAYPGDPGQLYQAPGTDGSYNAVGANGRQFLLPALWLPANSTCTPPPLS